MALNLFYLLEYYEYDNFNQVKTVRQNNIGGSLIAEYFYDHEGIRIKKIEYHCTEAIISFLKKKEDNRKFLSCKKASHF